jgi:hypothetical protein
LVEVSDAPFVPVGVPVSSAVDSEGVVEDGTSELAAAVSVGMALETLSEIAVLALTPPVGATSELLAVMVAPLITVV